MSQYGQSRYDDDEPRRYHSVRTRPRDRDEPEYVREETYIERGKGPGPRDLVFRGRDDSVEDIPRDFPPPGRSEYKRSGGNDDYAASAAPSRRARSARGSRYDDDGYDDDDRTEYGAGRRSTGRRDRRRRDDRDYESDYSDSPPRRRKSPERKKSGVAEALEGLGLGGIAGAVLGNNTKDGERSSSRGAKSARGGRSRSRAGGRRAYSEDEDERDQSRPQDKRQAERKWAQAAQAALVAGAVEAFRSRNEPGPWTGDKGKRIATAALASGGIDGLLDRDPDKKSKRHLAEAVIGGLAANRLANGPVNSGRSMSRGRGDRGYSPDSAVTATTGFRARSRSVIDRFRGRSASRPRTEGGEGGGGGAGALKGLVGGAAVAAAGKAIYDRVRSKSRKRRSPSNSSADSYVPSRNRRRDARRSPPSDTDDRNSQQRGLAATDRGRDRGQGTNGSQAGRGGGENNTRDNNTRDNNTNTESKDSKENGNNDDSSSTTDIEQKRKHMKGKELLTAGLATIATIHAAHGVYSSMEAHEKRHRLVAEGEMKPEEARKKQTKAWVQDAAAVGIAALGIKGAFSEWKEMNEQRREIHEIEKRKRERTKKQEQRKRTEEREQQEQMMRMWGQNPMMAMSMQGMQQQGMKLPIMPAQGQGYGQGQQQQQDRYSGPPQPDQSGNPYAPREGR
ncbi:hypothetical protein LTS16_018650 [Friedmanniomyces endolithicus]|nr:hypothetical protein LTR57_012179 [Friedmanniomyces endolithicus]KAK0983271.1 hypothetical protein LTS01_011110 [Friedmanniomyces endolithicus]KAK1030720.1 hypothetical protein LTS16_018650 [Friedmanniomyces endolithicus]